MVSVPHDGGCREISFSPFCLVGFLLLFCLKGFFFKDFFFFSCAFIWTVFNFFVALPPKLVEHPWHAQAVREPQVVPVSYDGGYREIKEL